MGKITTVLLTFCIIFVSCNSKKQTDTNTNKQIKQWKEYLSSNNIEIKNNNLYVLVFHPTTCPHCLKILKKWDRYYQQSQKTIYLILIEEYRTNVTRFIKDNDISIPHLQDGNGRLFENNLIKMVPSIVYINNNQKNIIQNYLGDNSEYNGMKDFLQKTSTPKEAIPQ